MWDFGGSQCLCCRRNFFGGQESGIQLFGKLLSAGFFYEIKPPKKTSLQNPVRPACYALCVTKVGQPGLYDFFLRSVKLYKSA